jgi:hypothetical protein
VKGLYFVGAQSESRGVVAGVLMGAKRAFDQIKELCRKNRSNVSVRTNDPIKQTARQVNL